MSKNVEKKERNWVIKSDLYPASGEKIRLIAEGLGIDPIIAGLLYTRGYTDIPSAKSFMYMESEMLCDPFLLKDADLGISRIKRAVDNGEKITVYGDYDVDGVTAVCTLYLYLKRLGAKVDYFIPNRAGEGYGVSTSAIDALNQSGTRLIITVDTGITAGAEVEYAKSLGIEFIITDHHECMTELPSAEAVINPHRPDCAYPFKELAGVGVVFKLISAYEERIFGKTRAAAAGLIFSQYADLVAIGTIADVMPIKEENRIIVRYGLSMIENTSRVGLSALIEASSSRPETQRSQKKRKTKITSGYIGYTLAPRINAAGRIKSASLAVELFLSEDKASALKIAEELCHTNKERQAEENKIMGEAYTEIEKYDIESDPVIVLDRDNWHHGVIGIVASRITEKYSRPSILVSFEMPEGKEPSPDDIGKGSGRSIKGMNLVDALCYCEEHLVKFGGHELAAGLSVTRGELDAFRKKINEYARRNLTDEDMLPSLEADCEVQFEDVSIALAKSIQMLEPFGVGNPVPVFVLRGAYVDEITGISDGKHTKITVGNGRGSLTAMYFSVSPQDAGIFVGDRVDILFNIDVNEWAGRESVQLIVRDLKISGSQMNKEKGDKERFEEIKNGGAFSEAEEVIPDRNDFAAVYKLMHSSLRVGCDVLSHKELVSRLRQDSSVRMNYLKLKVIIMVLKELNLVSISDVADEVYKFNIHYSAGKTMLDKSTILRRLRQQLVRNG